MCVVYTWPMGTDDSLHAQDEASAEAAGQGSDRNPLLAVVLAVVGFIIPVLAGAGHVYNGDIARGVGFSALQLVNVALGFVVIGVITYPICGLYIIYDAYKGPDAPFYGAVLGDG